MDSLDFQNGQRKLLNTEKLVFSTPEDSISFCRQTLVRIRLISEAVPWDKDKAPGPVVFNLSVGPTLMGFPVECVPHAIAIVCLFLLAPFVITKVHAGIFEEEIFVKQKQ